MATARRRSQPGAQQQKFGLAWIACELVARHATEALVVLRELPEYHGADAPFMVSLRDLREDTKAVLGQLRKREGPNWVVDMPGEALNFGPRLVVPVERVQAVV